MLVCFIQNPLYGGCIALALMVLSACFIVSEVYTQLQIGQLRIIVYVLLNGVV